MAKNGNTVYLLFGLNLVFLSLILIFPQNPAWGKKSPYIVVLDPGHGGKDSGAIQQMGKKKYAEKDIVLALAIRTRRTLVDPTYSKLLDRPLKVVLTREGDYEVSLEKRSEIARNLKANLMLSLHINSDPSKKASGFETYFLNNLDFSSSSKLEEIENKHSKKFSDKNASLLIRSIAADAMVDESKAAAIAVQESVIQELKKEGIKTPNRGVRQGMFYVLLDAQVPSILVESFFITHPKDLEFIREPENRQIIATGIAKGILRYLTTK